ncbi:MAG: TonB-dependent receptor plug domain-containing protein, partial [Rudaea sp.]
MKKTSMKLKRNKLRNAIVMSIVASTAFAGMAYAQDAQTDATAPASSKTRQLETIVVTGTRIKSQTMTSSSPVTEINGEDFQQNGVTTVEDLVNQYPQLDMNFDNFDNNPSLGYATVSLRNLGAARTLTLVNGRRMPGGTAEFTDLSIIPAALVKRVDLLSGGASAVYGADAVAGVVNFILDDEFEGVNVNFGYSGYQHDNDNKTIQGFEKARGFVAPNGGTGLDGTSRTFDLVIGGQFGDNGHVVAYLDYRRNKALLESERDYSACAVGGFGAAATRCGGSGTAAKANFLVYEPVTYNGGEFVSNGDGTFSPSVNNVYNYNPENFFQRPDQRYTAGFMAKDEINEHFTPYAEALFVDRKSTVQVAESGEFANTGFNIPCDTSYIGSLCADAGIASGPGDSALVYILKR